ncbi:ethylmalonyl-CoA decarboxylase isoform X4 [Polyodon spathula]|uniref:ethylmalonyl-CoA decarboxylase isoform X4 n=1 Tax=Polyodon spathula TaxID=7913 RepID=UPI001B7EA602|nr:ethylmalonyl-CoA decarboxylase isoform X4 [Polyodon spathula]
MQVSQSVLVFLCRRMALHLRKCFLHPVRSRLVLPPQRIKSLYTTFDGFDEDEIREKLQRFPGGSVDLSKQTSGIAVLTVNNPGRMNAFTGTMMGELKDRVDELEQWTDGKGLIVQGAASTFCSGSDLNAVRAISNPQDGMKMCMLMQNTLTRLLRLMAPGSEIRFVHKHMGLVPGWGGAARLVRIVGSKNALQLLSTARRVDPDYAASIGLTEEILASSDVSRSLDQAQKWLSDHTKGPSAVIRALKKVVVSGRELPLDEALRTEKEVFGTVWGGPANLEALAQGPKRK